MTLHMAKRVVLWGVLLSLMAYGQDTRGQDTGSVRVIDGDTLELAGEKHRLHGIDAPERTQTCGTGWACGRAATLALRDFIGDRPVTCTGRKRDRYKRLISICFVMGENINDWMVLHGWALAYRKYSVEYVAQETQAQRAQRGLWSGSFIAPWMWRKGKR